MPKMHMFLSNGRPSFNQIKSLTAANNATSATKPSILNAPMISRIHNIQPGCSSCGRH
jgi:hypothetical protein